MDTIYIGMMGLGTVGSGVMLTLEKNRELLEEELGYAVRIKYALVRDKRECTRMSLPSDLRLTEDANDILDDDDIQIVVEVMGGITPAKDYILEAIRRNKNVVSANKDVISLYGPEIVNEASQHGVDFMCEASVGGGIPILLPLQKSLKANQIQEIVGIVNGTTNYILTEMTNKSISYDDALAAAQECGYAEADPTADVGGFDAARKIAILSSIGFKANVSLDDVSVEGIETISSKDIRFAKEFGYVIKLLAVAKQIDEGVVVSVYPAFVPENHPLAAVRGAYNAVYVIGNAVDDVMFYGKGAGSFPTASAVVGDILEIAHHIRHHITGKNTWLHKDKKAKIANPMKLQSSYYFRIVVSNETGVLSEISRVFSVDGVSIKTMWQNGNEEATTELVMVVYPCEHAQITNVRKQLENLSCVRRVANVIRVFEDGSDEKC